jgi:hypothetical protein
MGRGCEAARVEALAKVWEWGGKAGRFLKEKTGPVMRKIQEIERRMTALENSEKQS